uniref:SFRICE_026097 n=1 Tax=Spodoptera frugiperda TaxID=7108 RepID=A0A2H1V3K0_SPOFR
MNKTVTHPQSKQTIVDLTKFGPSVFTLTFALEVVGTEVWADCDDGWVELGPIINGVKLIYQLYHGQIFEVEVVIYPHAAKIVYGNNYDWVRTWQFLERRFLAFSISHAFPVRVTEFRTFVATVTPHPGISVLSANAKAEKSPYIFFPPLQFGERRQFARVFDSEYPLKRYIWDLIWYRVVVYIPTTYLDGLFDTPYPVYGVRQQDAVLRQIQDAVLYRPPLVEVDNTSIKRRSSKTDKKKPEESNTKLEVKLSGDWILAGVGRVVPFVSTGNRIPELGEVIALISTGNLPSYDDLPIFFANVTNLVDLPLDHLLENNFTHIYTRWVVADEDRSSEQISLENITPGTKINFKDHHAVPLANATASDIMAIFLEEPFCIELRGIRIPPETQKSNFFGYDKSDRDFATGITPPIVNQDVDILIAQTKIDARALKKINGYVKREFSLFPPEPYIEPLEREGICTNDINAIRRKVKPDFVIQPNKILEAQMTLQVSIGLVGCKPHPVNLRYSRLYSLISDHGAIMVILRQITEINESLLLTGNNTGLLTGFALDTGDTVMLYVEGPKEGEILRVWERTADFYPIVKPLFSTSSNYIGRLYPELLLGAMPFNILKMFVPLSVLLGLTPIYARPALPLPTRAAVLKIGRLIGGRYSTVPCRRVMPTAMELKSFRLELCVAPRPPVTTNLNIPVVKTSNVTNVVPQKTVSTKSCGHSKHEEGSEQSVSWSGEKTK